LVELRNFGIFSVPPGFLAVSVDLRLLRDRCAEGRGNEIQARQNTGLLASKAARD
jgi:hypothetical protein